MRKGFTLIELLIVIAIIAILAAVVFVALDPLSRFEAARNSTRWTDITAVMDAIKLYQTDNQGTLPADADSDVWAQDTYYMLGTCADAAATTCTAQATVAGCLNLTSLATEGYLPAVPLDPSVADTATETEYYVSQSSTTQAFTIGSCEPEDEGEAAAPTIRITR